jgi:hypothetical protein
MDCGAFRVPLLNHQTDTRQFSLEVCSPRNSNLFVRLFVDADSDRLINAAYGNKISCGPEREAGLTMRKHGMIKISLLCSCRSSACVVYDDPLLPSSGDGGLFSELATAASAIDVSSTTKANFAMMVKSRFSTIPTSIGRAHAYSLSLL